MRRSLLLSLSLLAWAGSSLSAVLVDNQGNGDVLTIQDGINLAATLGDPVVEVRGGLQYSGPGNYDITFGDQTLTVRSESGGPTAIVDPQFAGDAFRFPPGDVNQSTIENLLIRHAVRGVECPGNNQAQPTIRGCTIEDCTGTGIYGDYNSSPITVDGCTVRRNATGLQVFEGPVTDCEVYHNAGAGIVVVESSTAVISFCHVYGNGGTGIEVLPSTARVVDCEVVGNAGSGIYMVTGLGIARCELRGNHDWGFVFGGWSGVSTSAVDCLVSGNGAGGVRVAGESGLSLTTSTVMDNGGIGAWTDEGWLHINRSILWGNCGSQAQNDDGSRFSELSLTCSIFNVGGIIGGSLGPSNSNDDPLVCRSISCSEAPFVGGDYGLLAGSPALPSGSACGERIGAFGEGCSPASTPDWIDAAEAAGWRTRIQVNPNPVRRDAAIRFQLPESAPVRLELMDASGRRLDTLVDEYLPAGDVEVWWSASDLPRQISGVAFLRLTSSGKLLARQKVSFLE